jgi:hypothetical protein
MSHHLAGLPHNGRNVRTGIELVDKEGHIIENYDTIFCELFCVAASALARQMNEDLVDAGILWDEIIATGGHLTAGSISQTSTSGRSAGSAPSLKQDLDDLAEKGVPPTKRNGHGHLMFLVRRVDSSNVDHLAASGYCFAEPRQVAHIIRSKMQIRSNRLEEKLRGMERYARGNMLEPGVHLGLFAVRTQVHQMGFDILVRKQARNLLPSMELPLDRLEPAHLDFLRRLEGMSLGALHRRLERANELPPRDANFASLLLDAIRNLRTSVQDPIIDNAKLVCRVSQVPCTPPSSDTRPATCSLIAFTLMIPIHLRIESPAYEFIPLPFFKAQQLVYKNSPHNAAFARSVHRKISPILDSVPTDNTLLPSGGRIRRFISVPGLVQFSRTGRGSHVASPSPMRPRRSDAVKLVSASREHVVLTPCDESVSSLLYGANGGDSDLGSDRKGPNIDISESTKPARRQQPAKLSFGGIMISQEVTVDVEQATEPAAAVDGTPEMPPPTHQRDASNGGLTRQRSQRGLQSAAANSGGGGGQNPPIYDQAIELKEVSAVLGMGVSRVEVKKEGDDAVTTFVDDLFSTCIDTPRRL